jgi:MYXO-CTERM domain-containing protein
MGEVCRVGECVVDTGPPDAGMPPGTDGGSTPGTDAGSSSGDDAAAPAMDGGVGADAGTGGDDDGGCGCRAAGAPARSAPVLPLLLAFGLLFIRRRRA